MTDAQQSYYTYENYPAELKPQLEQTFQKLEGGVSLAQRLQAIAEHFELPAVRLTGDPAFDAWMLAENLEPYGVVEARERPYNPHDAYQHLAEAPKPAWRRVLDRLVEGLGGNYPGDYPDGRGFTGGRRNC